MENKELTQEQKDLIEWIRVAPSDSLWPLLVYRDCTKRQGFSDDFNVTFKKGIPDTARAGQVFKRWDIVGGD